MKLRAVPLRRFRLQGLGEFGAGLGGHGSTTAHCGFAGLNGTVEVEPGGDGLGQLGAVQQGQVGTGA
jgi:hypothetical protein